MIGGKNRDIVCENSKNSGKNRCNREEHNSLCALTYLRQNIVLFRHFEGKYILDIL